MDKKIEKSENKNIKEITVKIEGKEWEEAIDKAYNKASKKTKIDGFRPGHAPKELFLKKYGKQSLLIDAADLCIERAYVKAFENDQNTRIVAEPDIALNSIGEEGVEFKFTLTLRPEVKLGEYKNLGIKKEKVEVTKEEVNHAIEHMRERYAENVLKEGPVEDGDIVVIDFEGFKDGVPFEGGKAENYSLTIGSGTFIPGFEEQLIGMSSGEEKEIKVTFPEEYHSEDLKGADATFKVKLHEVKEEKIPEINEEFFEDLGMEGINTLEDLEKQIEENLSVQKENEAENKYIDELLEAAGKNVEIDIPEVMIEEEKKRMLKQYEEHLKMQGITLEQYYQFTNSDEQALKDQMQEEAVKRITYRLMLEEIAEVEKLKVTDKEAEEEASKLAEKYQMKEEDFLKLFGGIEMVKYDLEMRKAMNILKGE